MGTLSTVRVRELSWLKSISSPERVALTFFVYLGLLGLYRRLPFLPQLILLAAPLLLCIIWLLEGSRSSAQSKVIRQWLSLGLLLLGYWSLGWFASAPIERWQISWAHWVRALLDAFHLRYIVE